MLPTVYAQWYAHVTGSKYPKAPTPAAAGPDDFAAILDEISAPEIIPDFVAEEVGVAGAKSLHETPRQRNH